MGQQVLSREIGSGVQSVQLDMSGEPRGLYFISLEDGNAQELSKLILQ
jgi:hypothetical protein